ncbi:MAG: DMT family transporter [Acholeplasmatales bacterium]|nr:DMT family transporter [Acholeplasmatales bacterium]
MRKLTKSEIIGIIELIVCTMIWGLAFVAQKKASDNVSAMYLTGIRFLIAGIILIPVTLFFNKKDKNKANYYSFKKTFIIGVITGVALGIATIIQQLGIERTSTGKAGFLTAMYIVLVPIFTFIIFKKKLTYMQIIGIVVAVVGVGLISLKNDFTINVGDLLCMLGAVFFTIEIMIIDHYQGKVNPFVLSNVCFLTIGILGLCLAIPIENTKFSFEGLGKAILPVLFLGIGSSCIAYTLQNLGQQRIDGTPASLLMSLESVFALTFGMIIMNDRLTLKEWFGCILLLIGVFIVQIFVKKDEEKPKEEIVENNELEE